MSALKTSTKNKRRATGLVAAICLPLWFGACGAKKPEELLASAKTFLAKNDRKAAVIELKNTLQADPNSAEARFLFGSTLLDGGNAVQAEVELRKAKALGYAQDLVVPKLALSVLGQGQAKRLIDEFGTTRLQSSGANASLVTSIAIAHAVSGEAEKAEADVAQALAFDPAHVAALLVRAQLSINDTDYARAASVVDEALRLAPDNAEAWKLKGDLDFVSTKNSALALESYRKAVASKPDFVQGHLGMVRALLQQQNYGESQKQIEIARKLAPRNPRVAYAAALVAYMAKDMKSAKEQVAELVKAVPDNAQVLILAGSVELETNSLSQAQTHLARALELASDSTAARRLLMLADMRAGQPERAVAVLTGGRAGKPVDPALFGVAGDAYLRIGDAKTAQAFFERAAKLDPKDVRTRTSLGVARLNGGDFATGFAELQDAAASDNGISADVALVNALIDRQQYDKALTAIDALERKAAGHSIAPYLRGNAQLARHDAAAARKSFEEAVTRAPTYFTAIAALVALDVNERKLKEAKARLVSFLEKEPKNVRALVALAGVESLDGSTQDKVVATLGKAIAADPADPAPRMALVESYLRSRDARQAMGAAQEALAALPDNPVVLEAVGRVEQQAGDSNQAIKTFTRLCELQPDSASAFLALAQAQYAAKLPVQVEQSLNRALQIQANFLPAQQALATLFVEAGRAADALNIARTVRSQRPTEVVGYKLEGDIDAASNNLPAAVAAYQAGLKQRPTTDLAIALHSTLSKAGSTAEADRFAMTWQRQQPDDALFLFYFGDAAMRRNDFNAAELAYSKVTTLQPQNAAAFNNLSWLATRLKKGGAVGLAERANELMPGQPAFMDTLAAALAEQGQFARAIEVQRRAVSLVPTDAALKLNLARILIGSGDKRSAQSELDGLQKLGSAFPGQSEVSRLQKML